MHGNDPVPDTCNACRVISRIIKPDMMRSLIASKSKGETSKIPGPAERLLARRSDELDPTLLFSPDEMDLATRMFTMGTFKKGHFEELTKDYLFLPLGQNEKLSENIKMEDLFNKYEHNQRFRHIFEFKDKLLKLAKELRIAQRPFIGTVGVATELSRHIR